MASSISKRQQARNERQLQELVHHVPGNDRCADCSAKNPGWASHSLGIFLCMRCAALHRKMGTHVSKVKSLSMDSWAGEQVEMMKSVGNAAGNKKYNPRNVQPTMPIDIDEVEAAMEKFIRQKYEQRAWSGGAPPVAATRQNTGSTGTGSWNEEPPPLPPKPAKRFGFSLRSASSTFPRSKQDRFTPPMSPTLSDRSGGPPSPQQKPNKPSQVFGMKITSVNNNFDAKLASLREMGFGDSRRNSDVLKSTNGSLERAIETLARMEGNKTASRALTPVSMGSQGTSGITFDKTRQPEVKKEASNPWEIREETPRRAATQPLPHTQEPPRLQSAAPATNSWNPFMTQAQETPPQPSLEQTFQGLQVSQTGPAQPQYAQQAAYNPQLQYQNNPWDPPANSNPWGATQAPQIQQPFQQSQQQYQPPAPGPAYAPQPTPLQAAQPEQSSNPFLRHATSQNFTPSNPWAAQSQPPPPQQFNNPFGAPRQTVFQQQATRSPAPIYGQSEYFAAAQQPQPIPQQQTFVPQEQQQFQQPYVMPSQAQPYLQQQPIASQPTGLPQQPPAQQYAPSMPQYQQPVRHDKSSILALYSSPQYVPPLQTLPEDGMPATMPQQQPHLQRSFTVPAQPMGGTNPFGQVPVQGNAASGARHVSNESADFLYTNGRHSPDAFSGLSARYMR